MAALVYKRDSEARSHIDRWRMGPEPGARSPEGLLQAPNARLRTKITGAEWITMTHHDKMEYVAGAMTVLKNQRVPMEKSLYGYVDALDGLFTATPRASCLG